MSRLPFNCRNTIQRLREDFDTKMKGKEENMGIIRVAYTITATDVDGKEMSFDKERILPDQKETHPEKIHEILERDFRETEQTAFITALQYELGKNIGSVSLRVTKVIELKSAGDDDQM